MNFGFFQPNNQGSGQYSETFSTTDSPLCRSSKKKDMKVEYRLLNDIVAKSLTTNAGSFDAVTIERSNSMVAINVGVKVNWAHVLFTILATNVSTPGKQSYGYGPQLSLLLEKLVQAYLGKSVALHPLKVLNTKSFHTYKLKNLAFFKLEGAAKQIGEKAAGAPEPKKKKELQKSKPPWRKYLFNQPYGSNSCDQTWWRSCPRRSNLSELFMVEQCQVSIPEGPEEEEDDGTQMGSTGGGDDIPEATGIVVDEGELWQAKEIYKGYRAQDGLLLEALESSVLGDASNTEDPGVTGSRLLYTEYNPPENSIVLLAPAQDSLATQTDTLLTTIDREGSICDEELDNEIVYAEKWTSPKNKDQQDPEKI
ncbi:hypothetical protein F511_21353 [Dorcoceras hygrometricum]|uniref:Uncharacterized protein n=1 Tax=Dorcoceras hygrometricum TaxID=472368 RepID=A0A2Z7CGN7_9LAMI|nr:hypothetical protein F511_21353 [Dorcoceras hygrometricum]